MAILGEYGKKEVVYHAGGFPLLPQTVENTISKTIEFDRTLFNKLQILVGTRYRDLVINQALDEWLKNHQNEFQANKLLSKKPLSQD